MRKNQHRFFRNPEEPFILIFLVLFDFPSPADQCCQPFLMPGPSPSPAHLCCQPFQDSCQVHVHWEDWDWPPPPVHPEPQVWPEPPPLRCHVESLFQSDQRDEDQSASDQDDERGLSDEVAAREDQAASDQEDDRGLSDEEVAACESPPCSSGRSS